MNCTLQPGLFQVSIIYANESHSSVWLPQVKAKDDTLSIITICIRKSKFKKFTEKKYQENISTWAWMIIFYFYAFLFPIVGIHSGLVVCLGGFSLCGFVKNWLYLFFGYFHFGLIIAFWIL